MKLTKKFRALPFQAAGVFFALGATIVWSGNFIIARGVHDSIPPVTLSFLRWFVAFGVIAPFTYKGFYREFDVIKRNINYILITSFLGITLFNTLIYIAGHSTGAINLSLIAITAPVFMIIFSRIFFNESVRALNIFGIILTLSGVVTLICRGSLNALLSITFSSGDIWMLSAAVIFAVYSLLIRKKPEGISSVSFLFITFGAGLIMLIPFLLYEISCNKTTSFSKNVIISIIYAGVFASIAGFFLWNKAVEHIGASMAGIIYYSLPLFSTLWAILLLGEKLQSIHIICMFLIISGIIIATKKESL